MLSCVPIGHGARPRFGTACCVVLGCGTQWSNEREYPLGQGPPEVNGTGSGLRALASGSADAATSATQQTKSAQTRHVTTTNLRVLHPRLRQYANQNLKSTTAGHRLRRGTVPSGADQPPDL
jgi:hypothetical protein